jgi:hypothetical protein
MFGIRIRQAKGIFLFSKTFRPAMLPKHPPVGIGVLSRVKSGRAVMLTTHFYLVPRLRMSGTKPLLPSYTFMARTGMTFCHFFTQIITIHFNLVQIVLWKKLKPKCILHQWHYIFFKTKTHILQTNIVNFCPTNVCTTSDVNTEYQIVIFFVTISMHFITFILVMTSRFTAQNLKYLILQSRI